MGFIPENQKLSKLLQYLFLGLVLLLVFMASALLSMRFAIHGREVHVPRLAGLTPWEAERKANAEGLVVSVANRFYSSDVPEGRIISQTPEPGATVRRGWKVELAQSLGPPRVTIPDLTGQSELAAGINLRRRGLELGSIASIHLPGVPPQIVVAQSPPPGAKSIESPSVDLVLSAADNTPHYVMPNFVNKPLAQAAAAVQEAGLTLGGKWGAQLKSKSAPPLTGTVVKQYPPAGQKVAAGTEVYFEVQQGTKQTTKDTKEHEDSFNLFW
ncbi:MAG TPA: PASTA domain-containing protein [Candidatus Angelobacter sp.]|nr:PASTA domain-containing protein [Candidatus Angelobacter sp.]